MKGLNLITFRASEPGSFQMKDQVQRRLEILAVIVQPKPYSRKQCVLAYTELKPQVSVDALGLPKPDAGQKKGRLQIAFAKRLQPLQGSGKFII